MAQKWFHHKMPSTSAVALHSFTGFHLPYTHSHPLVSFMWDSNLILVNNYSSILYFHHSQFLIAHCFAFLSCLGQRFCSWKLLAWTTYYNIYAKYVTKCLYVCTSYICTMWEYRVHRKCIHYFFHSYAWLSKTFH